jgi:excisionase family DNA binding protein
MAGMTLTIPSHSFQTEVGFSAPSELTVTQAAKLLGVSDGYINELLDFNVLEFSEDGGCRLIGRAELLEYAQERKKKHAAADELFRMFHEMGLSDD